LTDIDKQNSMGKIHKLNTTHKKLTTQNTTKQNYLDSVAVYDTQP